MIDFPWVLGHVIRGTGDLVISYFLVRGRGGKGEREKERQWRVWLRKNDRMRRRGRICWRRKESKRESRVKKKIRRGNWNQRKEKKTMNKRKRGNPMDNGREADREMSRQDSIRHKPLATSAQGASSLGTVFALDDGEYAKSLWASCCFVSFIFLSCPFPTTKGRTQMRHMIIKQKVFPWAEVIVPYTSCQTGNWEWKA